MVQRMDFFDVIIVGGGPAGLQCARELSGSALRVLLLEKREVFGDKLCAGGLTSRDMEVLPLPEEVIEQPIYKTSIFSRRRVGSTLTAVPVVFTVNRKVLGAYQRSLLDGTAVQVRTGSQVVKVGDSHVELKDGSRYGFKYLVGADGYGSVVRRHLGLKVRKRLMGYQYTLPVEEEVPGIKLFMDARRFSLWYAWIFPHRDRIAVGCCFDPDRADPEKIRAGFHEWLHERNLDPGNARLESCPISCDFRGVDFGDIFLVGEAAGLASGFTGEGIYQALVSGQEIARMILDPAYEAVQLDRVFRYNRILDRVLSVFRLAGPFRGALQELLLILMNGKWLREKIRNQFSPES
jgi:geranylgeranyl reductase